MTCLRGTFLAFLVCLLAQAQVVAAAGGATAPSPASGTGVSAVPEAPPVFRAPPPAVLPAGVDADIGGKPFVLPDTSGLVKSEQGAVRNFAWKLLTPGKRLLAIWTDARQKLEEERYLPARFRYAVAYTMVLVEKQDASIEQFGFARMGVRDELAALTRSAAVRIPDSLGELGGRLSSQGLDPTAGPAAIEILKDDERQISYLILQPAPARDASATGSRWLLGCMTTLLLKGKLVQLNVFTEFAGSDDKAWLLEQCTRLVGSIQSRN